MMNSKKMRAFAFTQIGSSHLKEGKECQDASLALYGYDYAAAIVCDGHGGSKHFRSRIGACFAVETGKEMALRFVRERRKILRKEIIPDEIVQVGKSLIFSWREKVSAHLKFCPFSESEQKVLEADVPAGKTVNDFTAYGSTFLAAIRYGKNLCLLQIGDGDIRVFMEKGCIDPMQKDSRLQFGATTSLCDRDAFTNLQTVCLPAKAVKGCWLSSDGVKNSFRDEESFVTFIKTVRKEFCREKFSAFSQEIKEFLPLLTKRGSGDDLSVAYIGG